MEETWDSFWGDLLLLRFHQDNPDRWSARWQKADWLVETLALPSGPRLVDLGCGDGILDICLAKKAYRVTAIDRLACVLEAARGEAAARGAQIEFVVADLHTYEFGASNFDAAIFFDTLGLMGRDTELKLLIRLRRALLPRARLLLDWLREGSDASWERPFPDGTLKVVAEYDERTRVQTIVPEFHHRDGHVIELHDPYSSPDHRGIRRRIYTLEEAQALLDEAGYQSRVVLHYRTEGYHMLQAVANQTGSAGMLPRQARYRPPWTRLR